MKWNSYPEPQSAGCRCRGRCTKRTPPRMPWLQCDLLGCYRHKSITQLLNNSSFSQRIDDQTTSLDSNEVVSRGTHLLESKRRRASGTCGEVDIEKLKSCVFYTSRVRMVAGSRESTNPLVQLFSIICWIVKRGI